MVRRRGKALETAVGTAMGLESSLTESLRRGLVAAWPREEGGFARDRPCAFEGHLAGGCIAAAQRWRVDGQPVFVKTLPRSQQAVLIAEAQGLAELGGAVARAGIALAVPEPLAQGEADGQAWLALSWLDLSAGLDAQGEVRLGEALAALHRHVSSRGDGRGYGLDADNFLGATPQLNGWLEDWTEFWQRRRLLPQLYRAQENGYAAAAFEAGLALAEALPMLLAGHHPPASLLHGDLWSGNAGQCADGLPALFDPAVHYGDRECDLAMTALFGGFSERFYQAYRAVWPLPAGEGTRRQLYQLYHVLNHFNLFGGGYAAQAERLTRQLLAELRG